MKEHGKNVFLVKRRKKREVSARGTTSCMYLPPPPPPHLPNINVHNLVFERRFEGCMEYNCDWFFFFF
jgi:hypothetical protein